MDALATSSAQAGMVIIGAGHCGGRAALALRNLGWTGAITVIGDEPLAPYERPPLSKSVLSGETGMDAMQLAAVDAWHEAGVTLRLGCRVNAIDRAARSITLDDGGTIAYRSLLLATGGAARTLSIPGAQHPRVLSLRTHADALALRDHLRPGARVVLVGGGFIGLEVAASAREAGCDVELVEGAPRLLGRAVPESVASLVQALHQARGTRIRCGAQPVEIVQRDDGRLALLLADGSTLVADVIVAGIGMAPRLELARACGLDVEQGIVVDSHLETSDAAIFAAGDVCQFPSSLSGLAMRQETWHNAETQACVAAANMLGAASVYGESPWFWSDQYDHTLQVSGEPSLSASCVSRVPGEGALLLFFLDRDGVLLGASGFGPASVVTRDLKIMRKLVEGRVRLDPAVLADAAQPLKKLLSIMKEAA